ncbi:mechanosensitive ion channel domain-containing protein [Pseudomonas sp. GD03842]|uniref:mechanosensitive ion channel family protein n=1 Tax=Pseudomonas sp. GD03842 TaxID=2975385 RepID=UPI003262F0F1
MSNLFKSVLFLFLVFGFGSFNVQAADPPAAATAQSSAPADAPAEPEKPEILVEGGLLGALSSSIDSVQDKLDLDKHLLDSWRLRADRAADELGVLVNKPSSRSRWAMVGDFLILSTVWIGAFLLLNWIGRFAASRLARHRFLQRRERVNGVLSYVLPYMIPALICLPLTLYVSHFMPVSIGRALALCLAYSTSSGIFSTSVLMSVIMLFNAGHKRPAVRVIRGYAPHPLFIVGFFAALSDALTSPQISRQIGGNVTTSVAAFTGLMASIMFCIVVIRMRRPVAHLIRNRPLSARLSQPALQQTLKIFSSLWHLPILLMILVSAVSLIGAGEDSQEALRCAILTTILLIGTVFLSTLFQHMFKPVEARTGRVYKERLLSLLHAVLRIGLAIGFIELLGRIWGFSLFEFAQRNALGKVISDSLSSIGLILLVTWLLWVVMDTAIQEALKPPTNGRSARQPSTRVKTILPLLRNAIKIILVVICTITTMANLGINVAPLLAGAGVVGLAIGFGSQQLVQDVITGLFIIIEDTISIGDWVVLDSGHAGTVESLTIRTLRLRDGKGFVHSVPFGQIKAVTNQSRQFAYAFFSFQFTYDSDIDSATSLIREAGQAISDDFLLSSKLQGPLEVFGLDRMDMNGIVITAQFRTSSGGQYAVSRAFNDRLKRLVDKAPDVRFAQTYPQLVMSPHNPQPPQEEGSGQALVPGKATVVNKDGSESPI